MQNNAEGCRALLRTTNHNTKIRHTRVKIIPPDGARNWSLCARYNWHDKQRESVKFVERSSCEDSVEFRHLEILPQISPSTFMRIKKINWNRLRRAEITLASSRSSSKTPYQRIRNRYRIIFPKKVNKTLVKKQKKRQVEYQKQLAARPIPKRVRYCPLRSAKARPKSQRITPLAVNPVQVFC